MKTNNKNLEISQVNIKNNSEDGAKKQKIITWKVKTTSRRSFFRHIGWGAVISLLFGGIIFTIRLFYPRVLFEPPASFLVGRPGEYSPGSISARFKDKYGVWIIRKEDGQFFCLRTKCTHLGCIPNWLSAQNKFKCPCHGSGFYMNGMNFEGPAPRPLDRYKMEIRSDGFLIVDRSIIFKGVAGFDSDESYPESLLSV